MAQHLIYLVMGGLIVFISHITTLMIIFSYGKEGTAKSKTSKKKR